MKYDVNKKRRTSSACIKNSLYTFLTDTLSPIKLFERISHKFHVLLNKIIKHVIKTIETLISIRIR